MSDPPYDPPSADERTYSVNELADEAGVTRRTVHYYISQGLLSSSGGEGRGTRYSQSHLDRLRLIRELQREHLPLAEIRQRLERLSDDQVADLLASGDVMPEPRGTAFDYIQSVLAGTSRRAGAAPMPSLRPPMAPGTAASLAFAAPAAQQVPPPPAGAMPATQAAHGSRSVREAAPDYNAEPSVPSRSQWERITLASDIELHVRRPLSRIQNRAVDKLVGIARQLLEEDPS